MLRLGRLVRVLHAVLDLGGGDLLQRRAGGLLVLALDAWRGAAIELPRALGGQHHEQVAVGHLVERGFQRGERHQLGTSRSGNVTPRRVVRQRSAWMTAMSWSIASFTSRLTMR